MNPIANFIHSTFLFSKFEVEVTHFESIRRFSSDLLVAIAVRSVQNVKTPVKCIGSNWELNVQRNDGEWMHHISNVQKKNDKINRKSFEFTWNELFAKSSEYFQMYLQIVQQKVINKNCANFCRCFYFSSLYSLQTVINKKDCMIPQSTNASVEYGDGINDKIHTNTLSI